MNKLKPYNENSKKKFSLYIKNFDDSRLQDEYIDFLEEVGIDDNDEEIYEFSTANDNTFCLTIYFYDKNSLWKNYEYLTKVKYKDKCLNLSLF